ncbi:MAG: type II secretion system F family protein [Pseudomonadota bacterium]|nr:type II secretion system F family protein [Pseudomonadota bacterium]
MLPLPSLLLLVLFAGAVFVVMRAIFPDTDRKELERRLGGERGVEAVDQAVLVDAFRPMYSLFVPVTRGMGLLAYRQRIEKSFVTAGMTGRLTTDEFLAYKLSMALLYWFLFIALLCYVIIGTSPPIVIQLGVVVLGSFFPDIWLRGQVQERQTNIRRSLPYVMDLLTLSVEAGLDFIAGVHKVCEKARSGPLIDELAFMLREVQVGASRQQALRNLARRTDMPELRSFAALLIQADILGASIGPVLRAQSDLIRTQRFQAAERAGAYAATKILFPLILFIMPAVFIVIFGPIVLNFVFGTGVLENAVAPPGGSFGG